jgi:soluble lytic murein transglycosylase-like protein
MEFLAYLLLRFKEPYLAISAFNAGPTRIVRETIPWTTFNYTSKVLKEISTIERELADFLFENFQS